VETNYLWKIEKHFLLERNEKNIQFTQIETGKKGKRDSQKHNVSVSNFPPLEIL